MEANILGIDHPLVTVRDLDTAHETYRRLGFNLTPRGYHPWGTANHFALFGEAFIELIGVYDALRLGQGGIADGAVFSAFIRDFLARREGLSLVALHSEDARADHAAVESRGFKSTGLVDFRRAVTLPDGRTDEAVVTLSVLIHPVYPNISTFICQQHKPELVWVADWQGHPNGVDGILGVSYVAKKPTQLGDYYRALYGDERVKGDGQGGLWVTTPRGYIEVLPPHRLVSRFAPCKPLASPEDWPCGIAMALHAPDRDRLLACLNSAQVPHVTAENGATRVAPAHGAGVLLEFCH